MFMNIITAVMTTTVLTSCADNEITTDNNPAVATANSDGTSMQQVFDDLTRGPQVDLSNYLLGEEGATFFDLNKDGTFTAFTISQGIAEGQDTLSTIVNEEHGTWTPFLSSGDELEEMAGEPLQGFKAVFDHEDKGIDEASRTKSYYLIETNEETGEKMIFNSERLTIAALYHFDGAQGCATRGLGDYLKRFKKWVDDKLKPIKDGICYVLGIDLTNETLDKAKCEQFYAALNKELKKIYDQYTTTDYSNWMKQIYTDNGKNPLICDMNIPGSHDSFTSYFKKDMYTADFADDYVKAQMMTVEEQWEDGIRYFDLRIANMKGNQWVHATNYSFDNLGIFHTCYCNITALDALSKISDLLKKHPGETAVITLQVDGKTTEKILEMSYRMVTAFIENGKAVRNPRSDMRLSDCAGKMIILQSWSPDTKDKDDKVIDPTHKYPSGPQIRGGYDEYISSGNIYFEDQKVPLHYQNKCETKMGYYCDQFWKDKKELVLKCFNGIKNESNPLAWAVNQASAFVGGGLHMKYSKNANVMNPWMTKYVLDHKEDKMGIITCDFAGFDGEFDGYNCNGAGLPKAVVETNRFR